MPLILSVDQSVRELLIQCLLSNGLDSLLGAFPNPSHSFDASEESPLYLPLSCSQSAVLDLCRGLRRQWPSCSILLVIGDDDYRLRASALDAGADDVLSYPFHLEEFLARARALLRRSTVAILELQGLVRRLSCRDLSIDVDQRAVVRDGQSIRLTVKEFDLLHYLLCHKEQVLSRQQILHAVWGDTWVGDDNLLDVYIRYLRKKIERPDLEPLIHTVRGVGFMLK